MTSDICPTCKRGGMDAITEKNSKHEKMLKVLQDYSHLGQIAWQITYLLYPNEAQEYVDYVRSECSDDTPFNK